MACSTGCASRPAPVTTGSFEPEAAEAELWSVAQEAFEAIERSDGRIDDPALGSYLHSGVRFSGRGYTWREAITTAPWRNSTRRSASTRSSTPAPKVLPRKVSSPNKARRTSRLWKNPGLSPVREFSFQSRRETGAGAEDRVRRSRAVPRVAYPRPSPTEDSQRRVRRKGACPATGVAFSAAC